MPKSEETGRNKKGKPQFCVGMSGSAGSAKPLILATVTVTYRLQHLDLLYKAAPPKA